jgi:hypothetical protein
MSHWLDQLALRTAANASLSTAAPFDDDQPTARRTAGRSRRDAVRRGDGETAEHRPLERLDVAGAPVYGPLSRRATLRAVGLAAGLLLAAPLRTLGPSRATAAPSDTCLSDCLADAGRGYDEFTVNCNSGIPQPVDFLVGTLLKNPLCLTLGYQFLLNTRRLCRNDCSRRKPLPPVPPPARGSSPPPPTGGCGFIGLTSCGDHCCPAGYLCAGSGCIPPPPPVSAECNPPCPPGKKCQKGQCVDVTSACGTCPPGAKCCSGCSFGAYCAAADFECRC